MQWDADGLQCMECAGCQSVGSASLVSRGLDAVGGNQTKTRREGRAAKPNLLLHINPGHTVDITVGSRGVLINDHDIEMHILKQLYFCHLVKNKVTGLFMFVSHKVWSKKYALIP